MPEIQDSTGAETKNKESSSLALMAVRPAGPTSMHIIQTAWPGLISRGRTVKYSSVNIIPTEWKDRGRERQVEK